MYIQTYISLAACYFFFFFFFFNISVTLCTLYVITHNVTYVILLFQNNELQVLFCQNHMCLCDSSCVKLFNFYRGHNPPEMVVIRLSVLQLGI